MALGRRAGQSCNHVRAPLGWLAG